MFFFHRFISNKEHWQEKVLQSFIYLDDILYFFSKWDTQPPLFVLCRFKRKIHIIAVSLISIGAGVDVTLKKNDNHAILITISLTKK